MHNWNNFENRLPEIEKWADNHAKRLEAMNKGCFEERPSKLGATLVVIGAIFLMALLIAMLWEV